MKRSILACFAMLSLLLIVASPVAAAPEGNSAAAKACQKGGYAMLAPADTPGVAFASQDACVSYAAQGRAAVHLVTVTTAVDDFVTISEDGPSIGFNYLANDIVSPGGTLTVTYVGGLSSGFRGRINASVNGEVNYAPDGNFEALDAGETATFSFTYGISDGLGGSDTATVTITITGVND